MKHLRSDHHEELLKAARESSDRHGPLDLFLSGGVSSQIMLHAFREAGIPFKVKIGRFSNYNLREVNNAISICENLNQSFDVLDIVLDKFFESSDAVFYYGVSRCADAKQLLLLKMAELAEGTPTFGTHYPYIFRTDRYYGEEKGEWKIKFTEDMFILKEAYPQYITTWFLKVEIIQTLFKEPIIEALMNDEFKLRESNLSSRGSIYKSMWPSFVDRRKGCGFDDEIYPNSMLAFHSKFMGIPRTKPILRSKEDFELTS